MSDIQLIKQWERCQELKEEYNLKVYITGDRFEVDRQDGRIYGMFETVRDMYMFLLGFDWGKQETT